MKKPFTLSVLFLFLFAAGACAATQEEIAAASELARRDYRVYLEQLKKLNAQYQQITGQMQKIVKEEGVPEWNGAPLFEEEPVAAETSIQETADAMTVQFDLPGLDKSTIQVKLQDQHMLHVYARRQTSSGQRVIDRTAELPSLASPKGIRATYQDGVLSVVIPKVQTAPQEIAISVD